MSYLAHFQLKQAPLDKGASLCYETHGLRELRTRFRWLLDSPGIGVVTGEAGVGKTAALHQLCQPLSQQEYHVIYHSDTDFSRVDLYRQLAWDFGLEPVYQRAHLWRLIKTHIHTLTHQQQRLPIWIIDEAHNLPPDFFKDFPAFLNFAFDSQPLITVWLVGHTALRALLRRPIYEPLRSRIQLFVSFNPITQATEFKDMIHSAFKQAGSTAHLISDSGIELIRLASQGKFRHAGQLIKNALHLAFEQNLNHVPDDLIKQAIEELH